MNATIVSAEEARNLSSLAKRDQVLHPEVVVPDLAHTVVLQAEQIAAVLALHSDEAGHECVREDGYSVGWYDTEHPCPTARALGETA